MLLCLIALGGGVATYQIPARGLLKLGDLVCRGEND